MRRDARGRVADPGWVRMRELSRRSRLQANPWPLGGGCSRIEAYALGVPCIALRVSFDERRWNTRQPVVCDVPAIHAASGTADDADHYLELCRRCLHDERWFDRVVEVATGTVLPDTVPWAKFSGAAWLPDGSGFVYGTFDPPAPGHEHEAANRDHRLRLHRVGTDASEDGVVYERPDQPEWGFSPHVSHDGRWLVIEVWRGTDPTNRIHLAPVTAEPGRPATVGEARPLLDEADAGRLRRSGMFGQACRSVLF